MSSAPSRSLPGEADGPDFMAQTRPRDATDGFRRGLTTAGMGVASGLATVVGAPVVGARQEGALGAMKGLGMGVIGGLAHARAQRYPDAERLDWPPSAHRPIVWAACHRAIVLTLAGCVTEEEPARGGLPASEGQWTLVCRSVETGGCGVFRP